MTYNDLIVVETGTSAANITKNIIFGIHPGETFFSVTVNASEDHFHLLHYYRNVIVTTDYIDVEKIQNFRFKNENDVLVQIKDQHSKFYSLYKFLLCTIGAITTIN